MRTGLLALLGVASLSALIWLCARIASAASGDDRILTMTALWVTATVLLLVLSGVAAAICVVKTFRTPKDARSGLTAFWNGVEVAWVLTAGVGLFTAISTFTPAMQAFAVSAYERDAALVEAEILASARRIEQVHCRTPNPPAICSMIGEIASAPDFASGPEWRLAEDALGRSPERIDRSNVFGRELGALLLRYWELDELRQFAASEPDTRTLPEWIRVLFLLSPLLLAIVFPLRLGRALTSFAP